MIIRNVTAPLRRFFAAACGLFVILTMPPEVRADGVINYRGDMPDPMHFHGFRIEFDHSDTRYRLELRVYLGDLMLFEDLALAARYEYRDGFPKGDCESLIMQCHSGGAHCCVTSLLFTNCGQRSSYTRFNQGDGDMVFFTGDADLDGCTEIIILDDHSFYYYSKDRVRFVYQDSPMPYRLGIWDAEEGWRLDRPGEFSDYYLTKVREEEQEYPHLLKEMEEEPPRRCWHVDRTLMRAAMTAAYYVLTSGGSENEAWELFSRYTTPYRPATVSAIFEDVKKAVREYDPFQPTVFARPSKSGD